MPRLRLSIQRSSNNPPLTPANHPGFLRRSFPSFPWKNLPNYLTYARLVAIPTLMVSFYYAPPVTTSLIFVSASVTDWLDGYLARRWQVTSAWGAFLDPVADKLLVAAALVLLGGRYGASVAVPSALILLREVAVSALREWTAARGQRVAVGWQGKYKTALTLVAVSWLLYTKCRLNMMLLWLSTVLTITSGIEYFAGAVTLLRDD